MIVYNVHVEDVHDQNRDHSKDEKCITFSIAKKYKKGGGGRGARRKKGKNKSRQKKNMTGNNKQQKE